MTKKSRRAARFRAGHMKDHRAELLERANISRERLAGSDLAGSGQAWRLWNACIGATVDNAKAADQTYAGTLARAAGIDRTAAGRLLRRFDELGVLGWKAAPRASHDISELSLPDVTPQAARDAGRDASGRMNDQDVTPQAALPSNEVMSVELNTHNSTLDVDTGTHHSSPSLVGRQDNAVESSEAPHPSNAGEQLGKAQPELQTMTREELVRLSHAKPETHEAIRAELHRRERFEPWHGDERTGDGTGDDEASQMRWASDNPSKARARRS
jgi:hypothetical protein